MDSVGISTATNATKTDLTVSEEDISPKPNDIRNTLLARKAA